jgi:hypothetical protein
MKGKRDLKKEGDGEIETDEMTRDRERTPFGL